jgi:hypothetical protein
VRLLIESDLFELALSLLGPLPAGKFSPVHRMVQAISLYDLPYFHSYFFSINPSWNLMDRNAVFYILLKKLENVGYFSLKHQASDFGLYFALLCLTLKQDETLHLTWDILSKQ